MTQAQGIGTIVVVGGKGGVGKTSVSAILVKLLRHSRLLVIDADPVVSLAHVLGATPHDTLGDLREEMLENPRVARNLHQRPVRDVIGELVHRTGMGFDLLTMGRTEARGCFCGVNELLRHGVQTLCAEYDVTLIDSEAGIEQVNRRAVHRIDRLIVVTDTSRRGFDAVTQVRDLAVKYNDGKPLATHLVINRVRDEPERVKVEELAAGFGFHDTVTIPEDAMLRAANLDGTPLLDLGDDSAACLALRPLSCVLATRRLHSDV